MPTKNANNNPAQDQTQDPAQEVSQISQTESETQKSRVLVNGVYATEYYKRNDIPYCGLCGEQFHHDSSGAPVCPENFDVKVCPRLN